MEKNVGGLDRTVRLILGAVLLVVALAALVGVVTLELWLVAVALLVGAILTVTGVVQQCPANRLFGLDTYRSGTRSEREEPGTDRARR